MSLPLILLCLAGAAVAHPPPKDKPVQARSNATQQRIEDAIAPYVTEARKTWPAARKRYLAGLPAGQVFAVTVKLFDGDKGETVFVQVRKIEGTKITGSIANDLNVVRNYRPQQVIEVDERDILDWTIAHPDGTEEGNVVGKFLDGYQPEQSR